MFDLTLLCDTILLSNGDKGKVESVKVNEHLFSIIGGKGDSLVIAHHTGKTNQLQLMLPIQLNN